MQVSRKLLWLSSFIHAWHVRIESCNLNKISFYQNAFKMYLEVKASIWLHFFNTTIKAKTGIKTNQLGCNT